MSGYAVFANESGIVDYTPAAAVEAGDIVRLPCGLAGQALGDIAAGATGAARVDGIIVMNKTDGIAFLAGGDVYLDVSAEKAHFRPEAGTVDFFVGTVEEDAAMSDTTVRVRLNGRTRYAVDLHDGNGNGDGWTAEATLGLGISVGTLAAGAGQLGVHQASFDAVAEAAQAALFSNRRVPLSSKPIFEARAAVYNIGDNAALDINLGLSSASHATDFEAVPVFAAFQLDGNSLNINTHSDDGSTDRAPADSSIDAVDDTFAEFWIDCRDPADVKFYVDGVLVDSELSKRVLSAALTTAVGPILHVEKTSDDTVADVRVSRMRMRTAA